ncbi:MAG: tRNA-dihydrouridine synthase, partial [Dehalococcoidia bacterium]|nr:tRNA-dihydrouridine synthase [Dehalococcoidia bacterium]
MLAISDDSFGWGLARLAEGIKRYGARACLQLAHCGRQRFFGTQPVLAPSAVPWEALLKRKGPMSIPREITIDEIHEVVEAFGQAAKRVERAGFDMVEIHGGHGYLVTGFLSPHTNRRADCYGGDLNARMRFVLEVVRSIRSKVSPGFPVGIRLSGAEYLEDGITVEETVQVARELERVGIDYIHISGGNHHTIEYEVAPMYQPLALHVHAAEAVKRAVRIPVMASGSITGPELGEEILESGKADFISMGRPFLADPYFANKTAEGRPEDICRCIRCNEGCNQRATGLSRGIGCSLNVATGREHLYAEIAPAAKPKKVMVVGGGPAGMEAARVAALRGHEVTLYEKTDRLGGYLVVGSVP